MPLSKKRNASEWKSLQISGRAAVVSPTAADSNEDLEFMTKRLRHWRNMWKPLGFNTMQQNNTLQSWKRACTHEGKPDTPQQSKDESSYCKGEASILGDVPVPGKDRRSTASARGHAWPPEVPFFLWGPKRIGDIVLCKLLKNLQEREETVVLSCKGAYQRWGAAETRTAKTGALSKSQQCLKLPFTWLAVSWNPGFSR